MMRISTIVLLLLTIFAIQSTVAYNRFFRYLNTQDIKLHPDVASKKKLSLTSRDEITFNNWRCNDWYSMDLSLKSCLNTNETGLPPVMETLQTYEYFCSDKDAVTKCMEKNFEGCDNVAVLKTMLDTSFTFCDSYPFVMKLFLALHSGINITQECLMSVVVDVREYSLTSCTPFTMEKKAPIAERQHFWDSLISWYVNCASTQDLDVFLEECDVTRRQVYAVIIASLQMLFGFGMNHYPKFEAFMQIP